MEGHSGVSSGVCCDGWFFRWLTPDHGFPVRMLIPGFIGGRMVKYLSEITVTAEESNNHYHYFDNRVLPPHVDKDIAKAEGHATTP